MHRTAGPLTVFVLGSFRDLDARRRRSLRRLRRLTAALRAEGYDAFISGDRRSIELAGQGLNPREMTHALEALCDVALYVGARDGRGDGWVSELTAMQVLRPSSARKRLLLLQVRYPLSAVLKADQGGYLATPPIAITTWQNDRDLRLATRRCLRHFARHGRFPGGLD